MYFADITATSLVFRDGRAWGARLSMAGLSGRGNETVYRMRKSGTKPLRDDEMVIVVVGACFAFCLGGIAVSFRHG